MIILALVPLAAGILLLVWPDKAETIFRQSLRRMPRFYAERARSPDFRVLGLLPIGFSAVFGLLWLLTHLAR